MLFELPSVLPNNRRITLDQVMSDMCKAVPTRRCLIISILSKVKHILKDMTVTIRNAQVRRIFFRSHIQDSLPQGPLYIALRTHS